VNTPSRRESPPTLPKCYLNPDRAEYTSTLLQASIPRRTLWSQALPPDQGPVLTTSFLTAAVSVYTIGAGITADAGTRLALQSILVGYFYYALIPSSGTVYDTFSHYCYFLSLPRALRAHWAIFVPAAFLRTGSRLSGSLSGVEPYFPVTRHSHGRPLPYHLTDRSVGHPCRPK